FTTLRAKLRNLTSEDEMRDGTLAAIVRYRQLDGTGGRGGTDAFREPSAPITIAYQQAVSNTVLVSSVSGAFTEYEFDFSQSPIPVNAVDVRLIVVFRGTVGPESSAIAVGTRDLAEPDPVDYVDGTDWECAFGTLYHVADLSLFPADDPLKRDVNGDGRIDLVGPFFEQAVHFRSEERRVGKTGEI